MFCGAVFAWCIFHCRIRIGLENMQLHTHVHMCCQDGAATIKLCRYQLYNIKEMLIYITVTYNSSPYCKKKNVDNFKKLIHNQLILKKSTALLFNLKFLSYFFSSLGFQVDIAAAMCSPALHSSSSFSEGCRKC